MRTLPAWGLRADLISISATAKVFIGNGHEVLHLCRVINTPQAMRLFDVRRRAELDAFIDDIDRTLHNYLSSAYSLNTCLRRARDRRWAGTATGDEYNARDPYRKPGIPAFMRGLRNATQHERIPAMAANSHAERATDGGWTLEHYITLPRDALRRLDWSQCKKGLAYLASLGEDPRLEPLLEALEQEWVLFTEWFEQQYHTLYTAEFADLDRLNRELDDVAQPLRLQMEAEYGPEFWKR